MLKSPASTGATISIIATGVKAAPRARVDSSSQLQTVSICVVDQSS